MTTIDPRTERLPTLAADPRAQRPLFIVGAVRSGTTLLRLMLDGHPRMAVHPEFEFAVDLLSPEGQRPDMHRYREHLRLDRVFKHFAWRVDPRLGYDELVAGFLEQCRLKSSADAPRKPLIGATVHHRFDLLRHVWPDALYVHIVRDPRAVADSVIKMGWAGTHWHGCERWIRAESAWRRLKPHLEPHQWVEIRYEDLLRDPEAALASICELVGEAFDPEMLGYPARSTYAPTDPGNVDRWRDKVSPSAMALVEARLGEAMTEAGYPPEQPPRALGPLTMLRLHLTDRLYRARFAVNRYGLPLYARERLTRRLGMKTAHERVLQRVHEIEEQHLK